MLYINEFLPNPSGSDINGEWIEIFNSGGSTVNLSGWRIENQSGKKFIFKNQKIPPDGYIVLPRAKTKIPLRNQNSKLFLYNKKNIIVHKAEFIGVAPEGKSLSRIGDGFIFTDPTPGRANNLNLSADIIKGTDTFDKSINKNYKLSIAGFSLLLILTSFIITILIVLLIKKNESLSKFFSE